MRRDIRLCFLGDSFTAGAGDQTGLGWVGRVTAAAWTRGTALTAYNLGIRRDTSADIRRRAAAELAARLEGAGGDAHGVVFCFGVNDTAREDGVLRVPAEDTVGNARAMLAWSAARWPTLVLGPPPALHDMAQDARVAALSPRLGALCAELGLPFLPVHGPLSVTPAWREGAARGDGVHPDAAGYAALAALVDAWACWRSLMGPDR